VEVLRKLRRDTGWGIYIYCSISRSRVLYIFNLFNLIARIKDIIIILVVELVRGC